MKKSLIVLLILFSSRLFSQYIFNDTSLYFIKQIDNLHPVDLSPTELTEIEKHLEKSIEEFNLRSQQYADSVNPKKKKRKWLATHINVHDYFFKLTPSMNKENQKMVWISGDIKDYFITGGNRKKPVFDNQWKRKFINGHEVTDGGSSFIYLFVNLTLNTRSQLTMNGRG
jgi:hypothetical protein